MKLMNSRLREIDRKQSTIKPFLVHVNMVASPSNRIVRRGGQPGSACCDWAMNAASDGAQDVTQWRVITHVKRGI